MVPVYSVEAWLALVLRAGDFNKVLALLRKGYECLVVLSFVELLLAWLGGPEVLSEQLQTQCCRHLPPLSLVLPSWAPGPRFVRRTLLGVLQNVLCSSVAVPIVLISWFAGGFSPRAFEVAQPFCLVLMNASQFFAVYCVVAFYHASREPLAPLRPVQKLLSIKGLVFCLFWQEAAVRVAEKAGVFDGWSWAIEEEWTVPQVGWGLLNCAICVEMFLLSILHCRVYPAGEASRLRQTAVFQIEAETELSVQDVAEGPLDFEDKMSDNSTRVAVEDEEEGTMMSRGSSGSGLPGPDQQQEASLRANSRPSMSRTSSLSASSFWAGLDDDPAEAETTWEVCWRFIDVLNLSDIPRLYGNLHGLSGWSKEEPDIVGSPGEDVSHRADLAEGAPHTVRNRSQSVAGHTAGAQRSRMIAV